VIAAETIRAVAGAVDGDRVLARLDELAEIGADPRGGTTRIAFSDEDEAALSLAVRWLRDARLAVSYDEFGNLFGSADGNQPGAVVSVAGSHLDTVPNGGRFDGALGVVAAIEAVEAMRAVDALPEQPLEVVVWRCEEPVRFSQGKVGSLLFTGQVKPSELVPLGNPPFDINAALAARDLSPRRDPSRVVASCLELHIEQGRRLERARRSVGVVTAIAAPIRLRIDIEGRADHSGATPMDDRRDALCAAAELVLAVEEAGVGEAASESVATSARLTCLPGAINVVPGAAEVLVDVRGVDQAGMERLVEQIGRSADDIAARREVRLETTILSRGTPTVLRETVIDALAHTARLLGHDPLCLPSGAGHDAQCLADTAAVGMLFVPSVGGLSHCPEELTHPEDVVAGVQALAAGWLRLADSF
jgi:beta-ureidopropionase / N-carbamoyl-L-amino-acid hydrolase